MNSSVDNFDRESSKAEFLIYFLTLSSYAEKVTLIFLFLEILPFNSQIKFVILLTVNHTILIMLVQRM